MDARHRLMVVDDEAAIATMLGEFFTMEGYDIAIANDALGALDEIQRSLDGVSAPIDLILLDVNMPGMDGFELCQRIRERMSCPIIFLTARIEDADQLDGFASGGDDYVLKPFSLNVLGQRVRAHLAREERRRTTAPQSVRFFSNITIDYAERTIEVSTAQGKSSPLPLTRREFDIVALLSKSPGRVYDRGLIYEQVWGWEADGDPSIVREHVRRIRKKLLSAGADEDVIQTIWGVGYKWGAR
ncbi:MAG: response regulator transcription factor [Collinsella sp.]|nr:response regulator transcription factor [Collinsella sp.]